MVRALYWESTSAGRATSPKSFPNELKGHGASWTVTWYRAGRLATTEALNTKRNIRTWATTSCSTRKVSKEAFTAASLWTTSSNDGTGSCAEDGTVRLVVRMATKTSWSRPRMGYGTAYR